MYVCECGKKFEQKSNHKRHIDPNRKFPCVAHKNMINNPNVDQSKDDVVTYDMLCKFFYRMMVIEDDIVRLNKQLDDLKLQNIENQKHISDLRSTLKNMSHTISKIKD